MALETNFISTNNASENASNQICFQFTANEVETITISRIVIAVVAALVCCVKIALIIGLKEYRRLISRLTLYLMIAGIFYSIMISLQVAPVHHNGNGITVKSGLTGLCTAFGFLSQLAMCIFYEIFFWFLVYVYLLATFRYIGKQKKHEIIGIVILTLVAVSFSVIPFIQNMYGLSGGWCWIRLTKEDCHSDYALGVVFQFGLFYGPMALLSILSLILSLSAVIAFWKLDPRWLSQVLPLFSCILILLCILILMIANHIRYAVDAGNAPPFYPLWLVNAFAEPALILCLSLIFVLHPNTMKKLTHKCRTVRANQPNEDTDTYLHGFDAGDSISSEYDPIREGTKSGLYYQSILQL